MPETDKQVYNGNEHCNNNSNDIDIHNIHARRKVSTGASKMDSIPNARVNAKLHKWVQK